MAITVTIADNADGTGAVATIAGSDALTTNTLYYSIFAGTVGAQTWVSAGTRTGDGTIAVALGVGNYLWKVVGTVSAAAAFATYYRNLTDTTTKSVWDRALDCFVSQVQALNLSGVSSVNVVRRWLPRYIKDVDTLPQVVICPVTSENFPGMMCNRDDVSYPIAVCYIAAQGNDYTANQTRNLLWRQRVSRIFRFQRLSGLASSEQVWVVPDGGTVIDSAQFDQTLYFGYQVYRCIAREPRGSASV